MISVREGSCEIELDGIELRLMNGALKVDYIANDLLLAAVRILDSIGDRRVEKIRELLR
jgi:hypothetical protein